MQEQNRNKIIGRESVLEGQTPAGRHPMKLHYYPETDSLYIELKPGPGSETRELSPRVNIDLDATGAVVGLDIDLTTLETVALPLSATRAA